MRPPHALISLLENAGALSRNPDKEDKRKNCGTAAFGAWVKGQPGTYIYGPIYR